MGSQQKRVTPELSAHFDADEKLHLGRRERYCWFAGDSGTYRLSPRRNSTGVVYADLTRCLVGLLEPANQLCIHIANGIDAHSVGKHGVKTGRSFKTLGGWRILEDQAHIDAADRRGLNHGKLLLTAQTHITVLRGKFNVVAELHDGCDQGIMYRLQT